MLLRCKAEDGNGGCSLVVGFKGSCCICRPATAAWLADDPGESCLTNLPLLGLSAAAGRLAVEANWSGPKPAPDICGSTGLKLCIALPVVVVLVCF